MSIGVSLEGLQQSFDVQGLGNTELTRVSGSFEGFRVRIEQDKANQTLIKTLLTDVKAAIDAENKQLAAYAEHRLGELGGHGEKIITMADVSNALKDIRNQAENPEARIGALNDFAENKLPEMLADFGDKIRDKLSDSEITSIVKTVTDRIAELKDDQSIPGEKLQSKAQALVQTYLDKVVTVKSLEAFQANFPIDGDSGKIDLAHIHSHSEGENVNQIKLEANKNLIQGLKDQVLQCISDKSVGDFAVRVLDNLGLSPDPKKAGSITVSDVHHAIESIIAHCEDKQERGFVIDVYWNDSFPGKLEAFERETGVTLDAEQRSRFTKLLRDGVGGLAGTSMKGIEAAMERSVNKHLNVLKSDLKQLEPFYKTNPEFAQKCASNLLQVRSPLKPNVFGAMLKTASGFKTDSFKRFLINIDSMSAQDKLMMLGTLVNQITKQTYANLPPDAKVVFGADEINEFFEQTMLYQLTMADDSEPSMRTLLCARADQLLRAAEDVSEMKDIMIDNSSYQRNVGVVSSVITGLLKSQVGPEAMQASQLTFNALYSNPNMLPSESKKKYEGAVQQIKDRIATLSLDQEGAQKAVKDALFNFNSFIHQKGLSAKNLELAIDSCIQLGLQNAGVKTARSISVPGTDFSSEDQTKVLNQGKGAFFAEFARQMYLNLAPNPDTGEVELGNIHTKYGPDSNRQDVYLPGGLRLSTDIQEARKQLLELLTGSSVWSQAAEKDKRAVAALFSTLQQNTMTVLENASSSISGTGMGYLQHFEQGGDVTKVPRRAYYVQKDSDGGVSILQHDMVPPEESSTIMVPSTGQSGMGTYRSSTSIRLSASALKQIGEIDWSDAKFSENIPAETDFTQGLPEQFTGLASAKGVYDALGCSFVTGVVFD